MAGVPLGDIDGDFAWQAWHLVKSTVTLRGRRGTLALVTRLVPVCRRGRRGTFAWQAWHALGDIDLSLCVAGVALGDIDLHFAC